MKKVLIVDDIEENRYLLESMIKGYGYKPIIANNGAEALALAQNDPPDIIISDILMPVMDGYTLCREWKKDNVLKNIPFVFYTATYTHPKDEEFAMNLGADKFLLKPLEPDYFIKIINQVLNDFKKEKIDIHEPPIVEEVSLLKEYNETLIRKMEDRMLKSEESEKKIREYAIRLEKEIEEKHLATIALKESEGKYRSIFDNADLAILLTAPDGRVFSANDSACKLFGMTEEEICLAGRDGLVDLADQNLPLLLKEREINGHARGELTLIKKGGSKIQCEVSSVIFQDKNGCQQTSMVINDLSEQKLAEETIRQERILLRTLINHLPHAIYVKDNEGRKLIANAADLHLMNCASEDEVIGKTDLEIFKDENGPRGYAEDMRVLQTGKPLLNYEDCYSDEEGNQKWRLISKIPLYDEQRQIIGLVGIGQDITSRKAAEEEVKKMNEELEQRVAERTTQLQAANKELEAFSYSVSHDLRAPLRAIAGFSRILIEDYQESLTEEGRHVCDVISDSTKMMGQLIDDLLSFSRFRRTEIQYSGIDMNMLANSVFQEITTEEERKRITFTVEPLLQAKGDLNLIKQVWVNLISNAVKFSSTRKSAIITIRCKAGDNAHVYSIQDNGVGFDMKYVDKLFNVFQRLHDIKQFEGTGVGLAIIKQIISRHNGKAWAVGEIDKGATVYFTLPSTVEKDVPNP